MLPSYVGKYAGVKEHESCTLFKLDTMTARFYPPDCASLYNSNKSLNGGRCHENSRVFISFETINSPKNVMPNKNVETRGRISCAVQTETKEQITSESGNGSGISVRSQNIPCNDQHQLHVSTSDCLVASKRRSHRPHKQPRIETFPDIPQDGYLSYLIGKNDSYHCSGGNNCISHDFSGAKGEEDSGSSSKRRSRLKEACSDRHFTYKRQNCFNKWTVHDS